MTVDNPPKLTHPPIDIHLEPREISPPKERPSAATSTTLRATPHWLSWIRRIGSGVILDIRSRAPWYLSDWTDAWNYRVIPATALIFFAKWVIFARV